MKLANAVPILFCYASGTTCILAENVERKLKGTKAGKNGHYEIWAADQSNSSPDAVTYGDNGSYLWIWDSNDVNIQLDGGADAKPLSCHPDETTGPCNLLDIFPDSLEKHNGEEWSVPGESEALSDHSNFGRLHAVVQDPYDRYVTANIFAPNGGYLGIIDVRTKEAIGLFRVTAVNSTNVPLSVHISSWTSDGSSILIANLHAKMIERINVSRNHSGEITGLTFDKSAGVYFGKGFSLKESASFFKGKNAHGNELLGGITGSYSMADTKDLTPSGTCKESGCNGSSSKMLGGLRPNNVPICPIMTINDNAYITFGGGGLFVLDATVTPMKIIAEYGNNVINGAGLCGSVSGHMVFLNSGTSASPSGSNQSTSTLYAFDDDEISTMNTSGYMQNWPMPTQVFKDGGNTRTIGNSDGVAMTDQSGQHPRNATRRDSHGLAIHNGAFIHMTDRIRNVIDVFSVDSYQHVNTYDLVSIDGKSGRNGAAGACFKRSVLDDEALPLNDPAPDLVDITPDGKYLVIAFRGPLPVTVPHAAQGSCVGVGIVSLSPDGKSGKLVDVLRTTNTVDNVKNSEGRTAGGHDYIGSERSDVHYAIAIKKTF